MVEDMELLHSGFTRVRIALLQSQSVHCLTL